MYEFAEGDFIELLLKMHCNENMFLYTLNYIKKAMAIIYYICIAKYELKLLWMWICKNAIYIYEIKHGNLSIRINIDYDRK